MNEKPYINMHIYQSSNKEGCSTEEISEFIHTCKQYFTHSKITIGSLCRKLHSLMLTLCLLFKDKSCCIQICGLESSLLYCCSFYIYDKLLASIEYHVDSEKDFKNMKDLIRNILSKHKIYKHMNMNHNIHMVIKKSNYKLNIDNHCYTPDTLFSFTYSIEPLSLMDKIKRIFHKVNPVDHIWDMKIIVEAKTK